MIKILKSKGGGKTTELIELASDCEGYIVCHNPSQVSSRAEELGVTIRFPLSYSEFMGGHYHGKGIKYFLIDNADELIKTISSVPIKAITLTSEDG